MNSLKKVFLFQQRFNADNIFQPQRTDKKAKHVFLNLQKKCCAQKVTNWG